MLEMLNAMTPPQRHHQQTGGASGGDRGDGNEASPLSLSPSSSPTLPEASSSSAASSSSSSASSASSSSGTASAKSTPTNDKIVTDEPQAVAETTPGHPDERLALSQEDDSHKEIREVDNHLQSSQSHENQQELTSISHDLQASDCSNSRSNATTITDSDFAPSIASNSNTTTITSAPLAIKPAIISNSINQLTASPTTTTNDSSNNGNSKPVEQVTPLVDNNNSYNHPATPNCKSFSNHQQHHNHNLNHPSISVSRSHHHNPRGHNNSHHHNHHNNHNHNQHHHHNNSHHYSHHNQHYQKSASYSASGSNAANNAAGPAGYNSSSTSSVDTTSHHPAAFESTSTVNSTGASDAGGSSGQSGGPPHYVDLHVSAGECVSLQLLDGQEQVVAGPATITMISQQQAPPVPIPVQVPHGHMIHQIADENGTLKHIILSVVDGNNHEANKDSLNVIDFPQGSFRVDSLGELVGTTTTTTTTTTNTNTAKTGDEHDGELQPPKQATTTVSPMPSGQQHQLHHYRPAPTLNQHHNSTTYYANYNDCVAATQDNGDQQYAVGATGGGGLEPSANSDPGEDIEAANKTTAHDDSEQIDETKEQATTPTNELAQDSRQTASYQQQVDGLVGDAETVAAAQLLSYGGQPAHMLGADPAAVGAMLPDGSSMDASMMPGAPGQMYGYGPPAGCCCCYYCDPNGAEAVAAAAAAAAAATVNGVHPPPLDPHTMMSGPQQSDVIMMGGPLAPMASHESNTSALGAGSASRGGRKRDAGYHQARPHHPMQGQQNQTYHNSHLMVSSKEFVPISGQALKAHQGGTGGKGLRGLNHPYKQQVSGKMISCGGNYNHQDRSYHQHYHQPTSYNHAASSAITSSIQHVASYQSNQQHHHQQDSSAGSTSSYKSYGGGPYANSMANIVKSSSLLASSKHHPHVAPPYISRAADNIEHRGDHHHHHHHHHGGQQKYPRPSDNKSNHRYNGGANISRGAGLQPPPTLNSNLSTSSGSVSPMRPLARRDQQQQQQQQQQHQEPPPLVATTDDFRGQAQQHATFHNSASNTIALGQHRLTNPSLQAHTEKDMLSQVATHNSNTRGLYSTNKHLHQQVPALGHKHQVAWHQSPPSGALSGVNFGGNKKQVQAIMINQNALQAVEGHTQASSTSNTNHRPAGAPNFYAAAAASAAALAPTVSAAASVMQTDQAKRAQYSVARHSPVPPSHRTGNSNTSRRGLTVEAGETGKQKGSQPVRGRESPMVGAPDSARSSRGKHKMSKSQEANKLLEPSVDKSSARATPDVGRKSPRVAESLVNPASADACSSPARSKRSKRADVARKSQPEIRLTQQDQAVRSSTVAQPKGQLNNKCDSVSPTTTPIKSSSSLELSPKSVKSSGRNSPAAAKVDQQKPAGVSDVSETQNSSPARSDRACVVVASRSNQSIKDCADESSPVHKKSPKTTAGSPLAAQAIANLAAAAVAKAETRVSHQAAADAVEQEYDAADELKQQDSEENVASDLPGDDVLVVETTLDDKGQPQDGGASFKLTMHSSQSYVNVLDSATTAGAAAADSLILPISNEAKSTQTTPQKGALLSGSPARLTPVDQQPIDDKDDTSKRDTTAKSKFVEQTTVGAKRRQSSVLSAAGSTSSGSGGGASKAEQQFRINSLPQLRVLNLNCVAISHNSVSLRWSYIPSVAEKHGILIGGGGHHHHHHHGSHHHKNPAYFDHFVIESSTGNNKNNETNTLGSPKAAFQGCAMSCKVNNLTPERIYHFRVRRTALVSSGAGKELLPVSEILSVTLPSLQLPSCPISTASTSTSGNNQNGAPASYQGNQKHRLTTAPEAATTRTNNHTQSSHHHHHHHHINQKHQASNQQSAIKVSNLLKQCCNKMATNMGKLARSSLSRCSDTKFAGLLLIIFTMFAMLLAILIHYYIISPVNSGGLL